MAALAEPPTKKHRSLDHNSTKGQANHLSRQLLELKVAWAQRARCLLAQPGHGISSVLQINKAGWKAQDKANLDAQVEAEREKIAAMRQEIITPAMVIEEAKAVELSND